MNGRVLLRGVNKVETTLTVKQLKDLGIIHKVIDYLKLNPYCMNEGQLQDDDKLTFDSEFKEKKELIIPTRHEVYCNGDGVKFVLDVINDCVICLNYSEHHKVYNLETISLKMFNEYYIDGLSDDKWDKDVFLEEVTYKKLR